MKFQADHSNTPLVIDFDGQKTRIRLGSGEVLQETGSLLLHSKNGLLQSWRPAQWADLQELDFAAIAELAPQVVIFGTGAKLRFAHPSLSAALIKAGIGMEAMDNHAACRTFNVLSAEGRDVLLALLVENAEG